MISKGPMPSQAFTFPELKTRRLKRHSRILATGSYLPPNVVTNAEIIAANQLPIADVAIRKTLGYEKRRVAPQGVADSDLLVASAQRCLEKAGLRADQIARLLVTKFVGDRILPMTASLVQRKLGSTVAFHAVDIEGGINAFLTALDLATRYIGTTTDPEHYVLIASGGIHHAPVSKTDPRLAFAFGDGSASVLLGPDAEPHFLASYAYTNHRLFDAAGSRKLQMEEFVSDRIYGAGDFSLLYDLYQMGNWKDTVDFYVKAAQVTRDRLLAESGLTMEDLDLVLVTENNERVRQLTLEALGVEEAHSLSLLSEYGNTMTAMLPLLLDRALSERGLEPGMVLMLISHGEGASGGGIIYRV
jgi:3-oxoacyl-[acyl-carrier-protein] synthase-3